MHRICLVIFCLHHVVCKQGIVVFFSGSGKFLCFFCLVLQCLGVIVFKGT